jgi:hypothetical protein
MTTVVPDPPLELSPPKIDIEIVNDARFTSIEDRLQSLDSKMSSTVLHMEKQLSELANVAARSAGEESAGAREVSLDRVHDEVSDLKDKYTTLQTTVDGNVLEAFRQLRQQTQGLAASVESLLGRVSVSEASFKQLERQLERPPVQDRSRVPSLETIRKATQTSSEVPAETDSLALREFMLILEERVAGVETQIGGFWKEQESNLEAARQQLMDMTSDHRLKLEERVQGVENQVGGFWKDQESNLETARQQLMDMTTGVFKNLEERISSYDAYILKLSESKPGSPSSSLAIRQASPKRTHFPPDSLLCEERTVRAGSSLFEEEEVVTARFGDDLAAKDPALASLAARDALAALRKQVQHSESSGQSQSSRFQSSIGRFDAKESDIHPNPWQHERSAGHGAFSFNLPSSFSHGQSKETSEALTREAVSHKQSAQEGLPRFGSPAFSSWSVTGNKDATEPVLVAGGPSGSERALRRNSSTKQATGGLQALQATGGRTRTPPRQGSESPRTRTPTKARDGKQPASPSQARRGSPVLREKPVWKK